ncbi:MAG: hypothetical protein FWH10_08635 [Oscillospiraceae bacterium]|nr:hypothetical protein [Oscillospiraceae bacterium]
MKNKNERKSIRKSAAIILLIFVLSALITSNLAANANTPGEPPKAEPSGAYLKYTVGVNKNDSHGDLAFNFMTIKRNMDYVIQEGDLLEYDVYSYIDERGWGAVDGDISGVGTVRDSGLRDIDGNGVHTGVDLSGYVFEEWYRRVIVLGVTEDESDNPTAGQTLRQFQVAMHPSGSDNDYQGIVLYDNIVITNGAEVKYIIFQNEGDLDPDDFRAGNRQGTSETLEVLVFTPEEEQEFKDAAERKIREEEERREAASIAAEEAAALAEAEKAAALAEDEENGQPDQNNPSYSGDSGMSDSLAIIIVTGGAGFAVIVMVIFAVVRSRKKSNS